MRYLFSLLIGLTLLVGQAYAANMVIIHSNNTQLFPEGQILDSQQALNVPADTEISLVFNSGDAKTIVGPYQGSVQPPNNAAESDNVAIKLASIIQSGQLNQPKLRPAISETPKDVWYVDVSTHKRQYCVARDNVTLWRPQSESQNAGDLSIKNKSSGEQSTSVWPARKSTLKWPSDLPVVYGSTYTVELNTRGHSKFKKLVLYQLPNNLPTKSHKVVWMVGRGCIPQANMLLASLR